jgi:DNA-binding transcriptional LysR family regulator
VFSLAPANLMMSSFQIEVRQLRAFVALAEQGTLSGAARVLGLAQSTVSEGLAALERAVGTPLAVRGRGTPRTTLTTAGETLLPHARDIIAAVDRAQMALAHVSNHARAVIDIVANESVTTYVLPEALTRLRGKWPNTRFAVSVATCADVRRYVAAGESDVGVLLTPAGRLGRSRRSGDPSHALDRQTIVPDVPLVVFGQPSHPLIKQSAATAVSRHALAPFTMLVSDADGEFATFVERAFRAGGVGPRLQSTGTIEGVKRGVFADTDALGLLPGYAVAEEMRTRRVTRLPVRPAPPRMQLDALVSAQRTLHPGTAALIAELQR